MIEKSGIATLYLLEFPSLLHSNFEHDLDLGGTNHDNFFVRSRIDKDDKHCSIIFGSLGVIVKILTDVSGHKTELRSRGSSESDE